jgi:hypothetical protein
VVRDAIENGEVVPPPEREDPEAQFADREEVTKMILQNAGKT